MDLASDLRACKSYLENHPNDYKHIGVIGSNTGGWVMAKAQEDGANFDFMIGIVNPSTSVREQQEQSIEYGAQHYKLSDKAQSNLLAYTEMLLNSDASEESYEKISSLLVLSHEEGWNDLLEETDIPADADDINNLWLRRHQYNPKKSLSAFNRPFLSILGASDWIVPYKENSARLMSYFEGSRSDLLTIKVAHDAGHSTEVEGKYITKSSGHSYWRFFRISPLVQIELIDFLSKHNFISTVSK